MKKNTFYVSLSIDIFYRYLYHKKTRVILSGFYPIGGLLQGNTMRISTTACYALDLLRALDSRRSEGPVSSSELAEYTGISEKFIQKIMRNLKFAGLVKSSRGIAGGHQVLKAAQEISLADILRAVEGDVVAPPEHAPGECRSFLIWQDASQRIERILSEYTLDVIVKSLSASSEAPISSESVWRQESQGVFHEKKCNLGRQRSRKRGPGEEPASDGE